MVSKRIILVLSCFLILISVLGVCAMDNQHEIHDIQQVLNETNASDLTGCCSVAMQYRSNSRSLPVQ